MGMAATVTWADQKPLPSWVTGPRGGGHRTKGFTSGPSPTPPGTGQWVVRFLSFLPARLVSVPRDK